MQIDYKYVFGTFEECDVTERLDDSLLAYIDENGLMEDIVDSAVDYLRDWIDFDAGDAIWEALDSAVASATGKSLSEWECDEEQEDEE